MQKEKRTEERVVVDNYTVYIADDGTEFDNEKDCIEYEKECIVNSIEPGIEAMKIKRLDGIAPINVDEEFPERDFYWFNIKNADDFDNLIKYYKMRSYDTDYLYMPSEYPALVCLMEGDDYVETMYFDDIIYNTKWFFNTLGYTVEIKKEIE